MRRIVKEREPQSLTKHRLTSHASYENYAEKGELRQALLREQGSLCCYCMSRIDAGRMKIEHWASQEKHPERQLDHYNLLGSCFGEQGKPRAQQSCDTHKGSDAIWIHPADPRRDCERLLAYCEDGEVDAKLPEVRRDLGVLNLNVRRLRVNRSAAIMATLEGMRRKYPGGWSRTMLEREIARWRGRTEAGSYKPYCQAVVFWLEKRLAREG